MNLLMLEMAFLETAAKATPHREPDFEKLRKLPGGSSANVTGQMVFIEEHNTGYDGVLERWMMRMPSGKDGGGYVTFQIDLLPGLISTKATA